jgi:hypothetical protein
MTLFTYPRLEIGNAAELINASAGIEVEKIAKTLEKVGFPTFVPPVLGHKFVTPEKLASVRAELRDLAGRSGYPHGSKLRDRQNFDTRAAIYLHGGLEAVPGELLRDEVWMYFSCVIAPDIVCWRWRQDGKEPNLDRFLGGERNCFGRLWRRADVLRDERLSDPWTLVTSLVEDNFTNILERTSIARNRPLAREIARAFLLRRELVKKLDAENPTQAFFRQLAMRLRRYGGYVELAAMRNDEMAAVVAEIANATLSVMGIRAPSEERLVDDAPQLAIVPGWAPPAVAGDADDSTAPARTGSMWTKVTGLLKSSRKA